MNCIIIISVFAVMFICGCRSSEGTVYRVGDSTGWAVIGNIDYNNWTSSKSFQLGDTLLFQYNSSYHNVLQVSRSDFHTCDATSPIATFASGNDSLVIHSPGHYYYICGFVGHCQAGQKLDIRVPRSDRADASPIEPRNESSVPVPQASLVGPLAPSPSISKGDFVAFQYGPFTLCFGLLLLFVWASY